MNARRRASWARVALILAVAAVTATLSGQQASRTLTWDPVPGATRYIIFMGIGSDRYTMTRQPTPPDATSWTIEQDPLGRPQYFRVMAVDANGHYSELSDEMSTLLLPPPNTDPLAANDSVTTDEDAAVVVDVLQNDTDAEADPLAVNSVVDPAHGTAVIDASGVAIVYTPDKDFSGTDTFSYSIQDGRGGMAFAVVTVTVTPVNDPPAAADQAVMTNEDTGVAVVLVVDDVDGDALSYQVAQPAHGSLSGTAPNLTYTPDADLSGNDSFTFTASDGQLTTEVAAVTITVLAVNDAPRINGPGPQENLLHTQAELTISATDVEGDGLSYSMTGLPPGMSFDPTTRVIGGTFTAAGTFTPTVHASDGYASASESFSWRVVDNGALRNPGPQVDYERGRVRLQMESTLRDSRTLQRRFTAVNLPPGLDIDPHDGLIRGRIERGAAGIYMTRVSVTDATTTYTVDFTWTVLPAPTSTAALTAVISPQHASD